GGEILVLLSVMQRWDWRARWAGYFFAWLGLALSIGGNAQQDPGADLITKAGFALAPIAMTSMTAMGLIIVKRHFHPKRHRRAGARRRAGRGRGGLTVVKAAPADGELAERALAAFPQHVRAGTVPKVKEVRDALRCNQDNASRVRALFTQLAGRRAAGTGA